MIYKTIGTGGDFTTLPLWVSWVQNNAVTAGNLNDDVKAGVLVAGISVTAPVVVSGWAPGGSGFTTTITADSVAAGGVSNASFRDNASVRTTALFYNTIQGAFIALSSTGVIDFRVDKFRLQFLQIKQTANYGQVLITSSGTITDLLVEGNILQATLANTGTVRLSATVDGTNIIFKNNVIMSNRGFQCVEYNSASTTNPLQAYDNTIWGGGNGGGQSGFSMGSYGKITTKGNTFPNFASGDFPINGRTGNSTGSNNSTQLAQWDSQFGGTVTSLTSNQFGIVNATEFVSAGASATDFRLKSGGSALQGHGVLISGITVDISGITRTNPGDQGSWQFAAGGGGGGTRVNRLSALGVG